MTASEEIEGNAMPYNILITGANGQLGHCLRDLTQSNSQYHFFYTDIDTLDICDKQQIQSFVEANHINVLLNAAAYTAVDKAEEEEALAYKLNRDAIANLSAICRDYHIYMVHISTDYVFSGKNYIPYKEDAPIEPSSIYGKSKAAGELIMQRSGCNGTIIRILWFYLEYGHNFVKTMLKIGKEKECVSVVNDQICGPTYAGDLAKAIMKALEINQDKKGIQIYHFANEGSISWYDFTQAIMDIAALPCKVTPIFTTEYPAKAPRPPYSVFNLRKIKKELNIEIPYWRDSLSLVINKLDC